MERHSNSHKSLIGSGNFQLSVTVPVGYARQSTVEQPKEKTPVCALGLSLWPQNTFYGRGCTINRQHPQLYRVSHCRPCPWWLSFELLNQINFTRLERDVNFDCCQLFTYFCDRTEQNRFLSDWTNPRDKALITFLLFEPQSHSPTPFSLILPPHGMDIILTFRL